MQSLQPWEEEKVFREEVCLGLRMGRKIPGKKHHGVKDPEKQQKARLDKVKMKVTVILPIIVISPLTP